MTIQDFVRVCKSPDVLTAAVIVLVGFGSFGLGRLSVEIGVKTPVRIENRDGNLLAPAAGLSPGPSHSGENRPPEGMAPESETSPAALFSGGVVASKGGTKYHFPWCSGAARISESNKIWFASIEAARAAGYAPASNCKGLK